jgi:hypothetical protein
VIPPAAGAPGTFGQASAPSPDQPTTTFGPPPTYGAPPQPTYGQQPQPAPPSYGSPGYGQSGYQPTQVFGSGFGQEPYAQPAQPPGYGQPTYGQPTYGAPPGAYGQPGYAQQPGYGAPAYGQPPAAKRSKKPLIISLVSLIVIAGILVIVSVVAKVPASLYPKKLSHTAVEKYITQNLGASNVECNGGKDFTMKNNGDTFTCSADGGQTFTVTIEDKNDGHYLVQ